MSDLDTDDALARACGLDARTEDSIDARLAMIAVADAIGATTQTATLGRYTIGKSLGRGGQGCVYEGFDPVLGRAVALKLSRFRCDDRDPGFEARALARIAHPNVVAVYALEIFDGRPVVVMERVHGTSLLDWIAEHVPPLSAIVEAIACVADGLDAIHRCGMTHRDVKPANILVDARGVPRLVDLGLAAHEGTRGVGLGTPAFAAPEQLAGASEPASDQYGLGATLRAALRDLDVGARLASIVRRATRPSPRDRFPSMADFASALRRRPRRRGAAAIAILGCTLLTAGAFAKTETTTCARDADSVRERVWSARTQNDLVAHYDAIPHDRGRESFATARGAIDAWLDRWAESVAVVCTTHEGAAWTSARAQCLDEGAHELETVVAELATLDEDAAAAAPMLAGDLPRPERCVADAEPLAVADRGPALAAKRSISLARRRCQYGLTDDCLAQYDAIERDATAAGVDACVYEPAVLLERGTAAESGGGASDVELLERAKLRASECGLEEIELESARRLADRLARRGEIDRAHDQLRIAEAIFERMGRPPSDGVGLFASRSIVALASGAMHDAVDAAETALAMHDELAWGAPGERAQLLGIQSSALFELGDVERATRLQVEALELRRVELGLHHPLVAFELANLAVATGATDPVASRAYNAEAIAIFEAHERGHELALAICLVHEAASALDVGDAEGAAASNDRAIALFDAHAHPDDPFAADALVNRARIQLVSGNHDRALVDALAAHTRLARTRGPSDASTLDALAIVGDVQAARGDHDAARRSHCDAHTAFVAAYGAAHMLAPQFARRCRGSRP
jgi:hypothetical protein